MARTANPDKPKIDALRIEGKEHVKTIKAGATALKKLLSVNAKLAKFDTAEIPVPETASASAKPAKTAKAAAAKPVAKTAVKKSSKAEPEKAAPKLAKGTKGAKAKSVTTAPKKRGRPSKADELEFD